MLTTMRKPFYFILCFLLTLFAFQCLPLTGPSQTVFAEENTATQEVKSPSFTVKGANITPVKQESVEKQSDKSYNRRSAKPFYRLPPAIMLEKYGKVMTLFIRLLLKTPVRPNLILKT